MGRRIRRQPIRSTLSNTNGSAAPDLGQYWDRLKNLIPAEVSAIYIAGLGVVPTNEKIGSIVWAIACLIFTVIFIATQTRTAEDQPNRTYPIDWTHVFISAISFLIWAYVLGGPFAALGIHVPWLGTLLMLGWTFVVPYFYKGATHE